MPDAAQALNARWKELQTLHGIGAALDWDLQTYMPSGGAEGRSEQLAYIARAAHDLLASPETGRLVAEAESAASDPDGIDGRAARAARRDYDQAARIPADLAAEIARHTTVAQDVWHRARAANDFAAFAPYLEHNLELARRVADLLGYAQDPYDALLDQFEPGALTADVARVFEGLRPRLVALARRIAGASRDGHEPLAGVYPRAAQVALTERIARALGYDFDRGRQDVAPHPFCTTLAPGDVRITTRYDEAMPTMALYSTVHETGHALYEQGIPAELQGTPLGDAASMGMHESQSRLWENLVGRSPAFCAWVLPAMREAFPEATDGLDAERLYRAVNVVEPSLIRVEADEVTYNLHIMLRFELERALLSGQLGVADLPAAWSDRMEEYLGVRPPTDADGVMQDVHWSAGLVGYFPTYTLGNVISGQLWRAVRAALPDLDDLVACGEYGPLLAWLRENVHAHGRRYTAAELVERATGQPLTAEPYLDYLEAKFGALYGV